MPTTPQASANPATGRELGSIREGADRYKVHPDTIRRRIAAGQLTAYRMGPRLIRIDLAELDALLRPISTAGDGQA